DLALGRQAELISELEVLVREHPLRERLRGQLMLALYRSGRQADALESYRDGRRLLDEELGLEPGEDLRKLERAILEQDRAIGARPVPLPARLGDTPHRRLRLLVGAGAIVLAGAIAATTVELTSGGSSVVTVVPNSVAVVDPTKKRAVADIPIDGGPDSI